MQEKPLLFSEEKFGSKGIGVIQLNRPNVLNALNTECYQLLEPRLAKWEKQDDIAAILIESRHPKAFCAGGDVKNLVLETQEKGVRIPQEFFVCEYFCDGRIHKFKKPVIAICNGITMGGGLGLVRGAQHRITTEKTLVAMPEVAIGLFPDVGATRFLSDIPNEWGLVMGLTGARIDADCAYRMGLFTHTVKENDLRRLRASLLTLPWTDSSQTNSEMIDVCLKQFQSEFDSATYNEFLKLKLKFNDYHSLEQFMENMDPESDYLQDLKIRFQKGSKIAQRVFFEAYHRHKNLDIIETLTREWSMALNFSMDPEFYEGIRAVLIDKDGQPKWTVSTSDAVDFEKYLAEVTPNLLREKFKTLEYCE